MAVTLTLDAITAVDEGQAGGEFEIPEGTVCIQIASRSGLRTSCFLWDSVVEIPVLIALPAIVPITPPSIGRGWYITGITRELNVVSLGTLASGSGVLESVGRDDETQYDVCPRSIMVNFGNPEASLGY